LSDGCLFACQRDGSGEGTNDDALARFR